MVPESRFLIRMARRRVSGSMSHVQFVPNRREQPSDERARWYSAIGHRGTGPLLMKAGHQYSRLTQSTLQVYSIICDLRTKEGMHSIHQIPTQPNQIAGADSEQP